MTPQAKHTAPSTEVESNPRAALWPNYKPPAELVFTHGVGSELFSEDGKVYLDFLSGIAVTSFGHAHPHLVKALSEQATKLWHTSMSSESLPQSIWHNGLSNRALQTASISPIPVPKR